MSAGKPCLYLSAREPRGPVFSRFALKTSKTKTCNLINVDNINKHGKLKWDNHLLSTSGKKALLMLPSQLLEGQILITEHANISSCRKGRDQWEWEIKKKVKKLRAELKLTLFIQVWKANPASTELRGGQENPESERLYSQFIYLKCCQFHKFQMCLCLNTCVKSMLQCPNRQGSWMNYYGIYLPW